MALMSLVDYANTLWIPPLTIGGIYNYSIAELDRSGSSV